MEEHDSIKEESLWSMEDGTALCRRKSWEQTITKIWWGSTQHATHKLCGVLKLFSTKYLTLNTNINSSFKRLSDSWKTESLAAEGKKNKSKNQPVTAADIPMWPTTVEVPPHKQDNILSHDTLPMSAFGKINLMEYFRYNATSPSQVWHLRGNASQKVSQVFVLNSNHCMHDLFLISECSHPYLTWTYEYLECYKILPKKTPEK